MILLIDYGMGNLRSVEKALERVGARVRVSSDPADVERARCLVVPGVGSFDHAVIELRKRKLFEPICQAIREGKPYLGLCLGLQLLFPRSDEGREEGFGILPGKVIAFPRLLKSPHMGWNKVRWCQKDWSGGNLGKSPYFYFVHSYYARPKDKRLIVGATEYGVRFPAILANRSVFAVQFHPEKSQQAGLQILQNFIALHI